MPRRLAEGAARRPRGTTGRCAAADRAGRAVAEQGIAVRYQKRMFVMRSITSILLLSSSVVIGACATHGATSDDDSAEGAIDSAETASDEGNVMMSAVDGSNGGAATGITVDVAV